jgi:hypothetical protein
MKGLIISDDEAVGNVLRHVLAQGGDWNWESLAVVGDNEEIGSQLRAEEGFLRCVVLYSRDPVRTLDWLYHLRCRVNYRRGCLLVSRSIRGMAFPRTSGDALLNRLVQPPLSRCHVMVTLFPVRDMLKAVESVSGTGTATYHVQRVTQRRVRWLRSQISH